MMLHAALSRPWIRHRDKNRMTLDLWLSCTMCISYRLDVNVFTRTSFITFLFHIGNSIYVLTISRSPSTIANVQSFSLWTWDVLQSKCSLIPCGWRVDLLGCSPLPQAGWPARAVLGGRGWGHRPHGRTNWVRDLGLVTHLLGIRGWARVFLRFLLTLRCNNAINEFSHAFVVGGRQSLGVACGFWWKAMSQTWVETQFHHLFALQPWATYPL